MIISGLIKSDIVIADPSLVTTNELYLSKSTGRTEAGVLADKVIFPKKLWGTPGTHQYDTHLCGETKALYLIFGAAEKKIPTVRLVNPTPQTRQNICPFRRHFFKHA